MAAYGKDIDMTRFMVALAPNRMDYRQQLDRMLTDQCGALRRDDKPLEFQQTPEQQSLFYTEHDA